MSIFEYYRMAIPMFVPSPSLLAAWQVKYNLMSERTWEGVYKRPKRSSAIPQHPDSHIPHDPNNDFDKEAIQYWISFADFYQWPHVTQFSSWDDLMQKLQAADLKHISGLMKQYNVKTKRDLVQQWQGLFHHMFNGYSPAAKTPRDQIQDFDSSMKALYNAQAHGSCTGDSHFSPA